MSDVIQFEPRPFTPRAVTVAGDLVALCGRYLRHLQDHNYAENTVKSYRTDLEQFSGFCMQHDVTLVQHVTALLCEDFVLALAEGEGLALRTVARKIEVERGLLKFAIKHRLVARNPVEDMEPVKFHPTRVIAPEEDRILAMIDAIPVDSAEGMRDRALYRLMYTAALRCNGVASLDVYDEDNPPQYSVTPSGVVYYLAKGGEAKDTVCDEIALEYIDEWLKVRNRFRGHSSPPALFLTRKGNRINRAIMDYNIKRYGALVGLPNIHCHLLRHRRGGEVYDKLGERTAAHMLGHDDPATTRNIYGHHANEKYRHLIRTQCPVGGSSRRRSC